MIFKGGIRYWRHRRARGTESVVVPSMLSKVMELCFSSAIELSGCLILQIVEQLFSLFFVFVLRRLNEFCLRPLVR